MKMNTIFLIPIRNDYESAAVLLKKFEQSVGQFPEVLPLFIFVDDGSDEIQQSRIHTKLRFQILDLGFKAGHQFAIHHGLHFIENNFRDSNVVILDGDGEDKPEDSLVIAQKLLIPNSASIIAARRLSRDNSILFRINYRLFRLLFRGLVGFELRSGNFIGIRNDYLSVVVKFPNIESHVTAAILRFGSKVEFIDFNRGSRIAGKSQMNFPRLLLHAYGAFAVFADILIVRLTFFLILFSLLLSFFAGGLVVAKFLGLFQALPGWTSLIFVQLISTTLSISGFSLLILFVFLRIKK
jgi:hypothetical protein